MVNDAVVVAPDAYKVLLENDKGRVLEDRLAPGANTEMHSHPAVVGVDLSNAKFKFTFPDGQNMKIDMEAGQAVYLYAVDHAIENTGTTEANAILVELK